MLMLDEGTESREMAACRATGHKDCCCIAAVVTGVRVRPGQHSLGIGEVISEAETWQKTVCRTNTRPPSGTLVIQQCSCFSPVPARRIATAVKRNQHRSRRSRFSRVIDVQTLPRILAIHDPPCSQHRWWAPWKRK